MFSYQFFLSIKLDNNAFKNESIFIHTDLFYVYLLGIGNKICIYCMYVKYTIGFNFHLSVLAQILPAEYRRQPFGFYQFEKILPQKKQLTKLQQIRKRYEK